MIADAVMVTVARFPEHRRRLLDVSDALKCRMSWTIGVDIPCTNRRAQLLLICNDINGMLGKFRRSRRLQ